MKQVGVEAIVSGLSSFLGDMKKMDKSIRDLIPGNTLLEKAFVSLGDTVSNFAGGVLRTLEYALGSLIADAIESVIGKIKELIGETIDAGGEFQNLEVRLNRLNLNDLTESGEEYNAATRKSIELTQEQLEWLMRLAAQTPYDNTDIANIYTLARSYNFADQQARDLTVAITDFASGMALGNDEMVRIVENLGQMVQQGKITSTEMRDLARGAFVPVADVMDLVIKNMEESGATSMDFSVKIQSLNDKLSGYQTALEIAKQRQAEFTDKTKESVRMANKATIDKLTAQIQDVNMELASYNALTEGTGTITEEMFKKIKKEGIPAEEFVKAFIELAGTEFAGAAKAMGQTFARASENTLDLIRSIGGFYIVKPILDILGKAISNLNSAFSESDEVWGRLTTTAKRIGDAISGILEKLFSFSSEDATGFANGVIDVLDKIATWLETNSDVIVNWVKSAVDWIEGTLIPAIQDVWKWLFVSSGEGMDTGALQQFAQFIMDVLIPAIVDVSTWVRDVLIPFLVDLGPAFEALIPLGIAIADVFMKMFGVEEGQKFADFVTETLVPAIEGFTQWINDNQDLIIFLIKAFVALQVIQIVVAFVAGLVIKFVLFATTVALVIASLSTLSAAFLIAIGIVAAVSVAIVEMVIVFGTIFSAALLLGFYIKQYVIDSFQNVINTVASVISAIKNGDWAGAGQAVMDGFKNGLLVGVQPIINTVGDLVIRIINTFKSLFGIASPSTVMFDMGYNLMAGLVQGIQAGASIVTSAAQTVAQSVIGAVQGLFQMHSPSKLMMDMGANVMKGFAQGIIDSAGMVTGAMQGAMARATLPAMTAPVAAYSSAAPSSTKNYNTTNNFNLAINSSANTEPIIQDYGMLQSLAGAT